LKLSTPSQPPLLNKNGVNASFDKNVLLVYLPSSNGELATLNHISNGDDSKFDPMRSKRELLMRYCSWFFEKKDTDGINN
jgi:hypothetical protein